MIFVAISLTGGVVGTMAITKALFYVNYVNLSIVILIQKLQPVFAITFAILLLKERPSKSFYGWAALAVIGAYLVTFGIKSPVLQAGNSIIYAALFSLLAAASFGASTVFSKMGLNRVDFRTGTYLRFAITVLIMSIILGFIPESQQFEAVTRRHLIVFLIIAFTTGGAAIFLYYYGLRKISASVATICELSFPLTAVILEYAIRRNMLDVFQWLGAILLVISILRVSRMKHSTKSLPDFIQS